jgi:hypothetical protein
VWVTRRWVTFAWLFSESRAFWWCNNARDILVIELLDQGHLGNFKTQFSLLFIYFILYL